MPGKSILHGPSTGSGTVVVGVALIALLGLLCLGYSTGWDATWRTVGVTPLHPHFFDMHAVTDHAACAAKGFNAYDLNSCNPKTKFNYPPVWLWLGYVGINGSAAAWLSILMTATAFGVVATLLKGRSISNGALASMAILSPSVMMAVERGNIDLLILSLVGGAALIFSEQKLSRVLWATAVIALAVVLKLYPIFCISLAARFNRRTFLFAAALVIASLIYFAVISDFLPIIRLNTPTSGLLSYGYQAIFIGLDHLRGEGGRDPINLTSTRLPIALAIVTLILAGATAAYIIRRRMSFCAVADGAAGVAFLFGSGIYCGTFLLGTNFIYRLVFLLLCVPQLQDLASERFDNNARTATIGRVLQIAILLALWSNGNSNGHSTFMLVPQLLDWSIFFALTTILGFNFLNSATDLAGTDFRQPTDT